MINCRVLVFDDNGYEGLYCGSSALKDVDPDYLSGYLQCLIDKGYRPEICDVERVA